MDHPFRASESRPDLGRREVLSTRPGLGKSCEAVDADEPFWKQLVDPLDGCAAMPGVLRRHGRVAVFKEIRPGVFDQGPVGFGEHGNPIL